MAYKNKVDEQKYGAEYYRNNRIACNERMKNWRLRNKEYNEKYYQIHKKETQKHNQEYYMKNKEKIIKQQRQYEKNRRIENPKYKLNKNISRSIRYSLNNKKENIHWESLVDFTLKDLIKHLEKQFTQEMSWDNYGSYWHIDHEIPKSVFNFDSYNQLDFKRCWALKNLRPLEKTRNIKKQDKIDQPFQPSLKIEERK